jgi:sorting nexin-7/30
MGQTVRAIASSMRGVKHRPEEFMEMNNFIEVFSQKINLIDKISQRIYKEERGMWNYCGVISKLYSVFWTFANKGW